MTTQSQLLDLLKEVRNNPLLEPEFFEALLSATVYAHVPVLQVPGRVRFIQFQRPDDGQAVLPFFSDLSKAQLALGSSNQVSIVAMDARQLFDLTQGATLMLNPNDDPCALYPEEIAALLAGQPLVAFSREDLLEPETVGVIAPTVPVDTLIDVLKGYCERESEVRAGFILEVRRGKDCQDASLLVAIAVPDFASERVIRTSMQLVQPLIGDLGLPLIMTAIGPDKVASSFYQGAVKFYTKP